MYEYFFKSQVLFVIFVILSLGSSIKQASSTSTGVEECDKNIYKITSFSTIDPDLSQWQIFPSSNKTLVAMNGEDLKNLPEGVYDAQEVILMGNVRDYIYKLGWFPHLNYLDLYNSNLCNQSTRVNEGLDLIASLSTLRGLNLSCRFINDEGLKKLSALTNLEQLNLYNTFITGKTLGCLSGQIKWLNLSYTGVCDEYMEEVPFQNLSYLNVHHTSVSEAALNRLMNKTTSFKKAQGQVLEQITFIK